VSDVYRESIEDPLLSRRSFLAALAVGAAALALDPYRYVTARAGVYGNARLGLSLLLPEGWVFSSVADFVALRERQELLDELPDELHPLKDPENLPVFVFEGPRERASCNPALVLFDEPADAPPDQCEGHRWMLDGFALSYRDLVVSDEPREVRLAGARGTVSRWLYTHDVPGQSCRRTVRTLIVFTHQRAHTFHLADDAVSPACNGEVWHRFLESVRYEG
jgi:hypothetical protein